jgi:hypothetical protein
MLNYFLTSLPRAILGARGSYFKSVVGALDLCELAGTVPSFASVWLHNVKPNSVALSAWHDSLKNPA